MALDFERLSFAACLTFMFLLVSSSAGSAPQYTAALLRSGLPGDDPALVDAVSSEVEAAGYAVTELDSAGLCDSAQLNAENFDLLVLPNAASLPARSTQPIESYLRGGGDIIALNAPLWQQALINLNGRWLARDEYQRESAAELPPTVLFDFTPDDISDWHRSGNALDVPTSHETVSDGPAPGQRALHVVISNLTSWDTFGPQNLESPFPEGHTLTVFSAKGGPGTNQLAVEWSEKDGARWIAVVALTPEWRQYILTPQDFRFWTSNPKRGYRGDCFRPENAQGMSVGLAFTHTTGVAQGRHEYWIGPFGTAKTTPEIEKALAMFDPPRLDTLSPGYKLFECHEVRALHVRDDQTVVKPCELPLPTVIRSPHPRPKGGGFDKGRTWRWIPLVEATTAAGDWRGTPVTLTAHADGPFKGGVWASFGVGDSDWYKSPAALQIIRQIAERMRNGVFMVDGGANFYTYFEDQKIKTGVRVANLDKNDHSNLDVRVKLTTKADQPAVLGQSWRVNLKPGEERTVSGSWKPRGWPDGGLMATAEIVEDGQVIDRVTHEVHVWKPKEKKNFITVKDGEFMLDGKRWRAHGINYMPSSGIGTEDGQYFEHYLGARSYDPEVAQRDLEHIKELGFNSVSIFVYCGHEKAQNLNDLLRRLDALGLKANVSLRPGTPMDFLWPQIGEIIKNARLQDNDTVFAYDLAWEPSFGTQEQRKPYDGEWADWVVERYGSVENAEKDWSFPIPRDEAGKITNPLPHQIDTDGEWRVMTAAYRRFLDTLLYKRYGAARRLVRSIDSNHLVSFRMSETANPTYRWEGRITYDFPYLAAGVDILAPEAYGRIGSWERVSPGWFVFEYARWAAPEKPMFWAEAGVSSWDVSRMANSAYRLQVQADAYREFYRMLINSGADGVFFWWYPGGFRAGENSDFGIINPDGTDREVTRVIREHAGKFLDGPSAKPVDFWIEIDRDAHPDGVTGIYDKVKAKFWKAIEKGFVPGLRTAGTGTDSSNCPLFAVGNTPCNGSNPLKYLDASIDVVEVQDADGKWTPVEKGGTVEVSGAKPVLARIEITNLGEARLLAPGKANSKAGMVYVTARMDDQEIRTALPEDVPHLSSVTIEEVVLAPAGLKGSALVTLTFDAEGRTGFGEKFKIALVPK